MMKVVWFGRHFYMESGTMIGSLELEDGSRTNWGIIEGALDEGQEVHLRPASPTEMVRKEKDLRQYKAERAERDRASASATAEQK